MNWIDLKAHALHFVAPLKVPLGAVIGGIAALTSVDAVQPSIWVEVLQLVVALLVLRTIVFFEFQQHEKREALLLDKLLTVSNAFDVVAGSLRAEVAVVKEKAEKVVGRVDQVEIKVDAHDRRLLRIEESPIGKKFLPRETF